MQHAIVAVVPTHHFGELEECFPVRGVVVVTDQSISFQVVHTAHVANTTVAMEVARLLKDDVVERYENSLPSAVACFVEDFEACIAHLRFPLSHRKAIRTTNLLERLFEEDRRRTKVMPHAFGERPLLKVMYAAVIRASAKWRGLKTTVFERQQLEAIRKELNDAFTQHHKPATNASAPSRISSRTGT